MCMGASPNDIISPFRWHVGLFVIVNHPGVTITGMWLLGIWGTGFYFWHRAFLTEGKKLEAGMLSENMRVFYWRGFLSIGVSSKLGSMPRIFSNCFSSESPIVTQKCKWLKRSLKPSIPQYVLEGVRVFSFWGSDLFSGHFKLGHIVLTH